MNLFWDDQQEFHDNKDFEYILHLDDDSLQNFLDNIQLYNNFSPKGRQVPVVCFVYVINFFVSI